MHTNPFLSIGTAFVPADLNDLPSVVLTCMADGDAQVLFFFTRGASTSKSPLPDGPSSLNHLDHEARGEQSPTMSSTGKEDKDEF